MKCAVEVTNLIVKYGNTIAVDDISFTINKGEIIGIIGENGAGKTTTVECIAGIKKNFKGNINVLGKDISKVKRSFYNHLSIQLQNSLFPDKLKVKEIMDLFSSFYKSPLSYMEILSKFDLLDKMDAYFGNLSGGQKQKISIIVALISNADVLILDELTTGLDPQSRLTSINVIKEFSQGKTLILTTHFLDEIERLCDRVCIMKKGKIIEFGVLNDLYKKNEMQYKVVIKTHDEKEKEKIKLKLNDYFILTSGVQINVFGNSSNMINIIENKLNELQISCEMEIKFPNIDDLYFKLFNESFPEI